MLVSFSNRELCQARCTNRADFWLVRLSLIQASIDVDLALHRRLLAEIRIANQAAVVLHAHILNEESKTAVINYVTLVTIDRQILDNAFCYEPLNNSQIRNFESGGC